MNFSELKISGPSLSLEKNGFQPLPIYYAHFQPAHLFNLKKIHPDRLFGSARLFLAKTSTLPCLLGTSE